MNQAVLTALIAALTAFGSQVFLPLIKNYFGFAGKQLDDNTDIRKYMASELDKRDGKIKELETKINEINQETQKWRDLYYAQLEVNQKQAVQITALQELVAKNATIVQNNANNVAGAMEKAKEEIRKI